MITKIEIDGFKSFENFSMEFYPFTVIAGVNGAGKSNLFDAMRHLSFLVDKTLRESFETDRGSLLDLFTRFPSGKRKQTIEYAVELLLPKKVEDDFSEVKNLKYLRIRYELAVEIDEQGSFQIKREKLLPIQRAKDTFLKIYKTVKDELPSITGGRNPFIDTDKNKITISQDGNAGSKRGFSLEGAQRTVLSSITSVEFPHAYATRSILKNIHFLQLNPEELRKPSKFSASPFLTSKGKNLSSMVARLCTKDPVVEQMISNDLASIIPSVKGFSIQEDKVREEYVITVEHIDGYDIPSKLLSDGTLRILALIAISHDSQFNGIIILEEPENGVHPGRINSVVNLLRDMTEPLDVKMPMRQIITNTHSNKLIYYVRDDYLAIAVPIKKNDSEFGMRTSTRINYVNGDFLSGNEDRVARQELNRMLESQDTIAEAV